MVKLSIIIVAYRNMECLADCLNSIPLLPWIEVIVVNNSHQNRGFSGGCNLGASLATGEKLLFLNPDCLVDEIALARLVKILDEDPTIGIIGPKLRNSDGKEYLSCNRPLSRLASPFVYSFLNSLLHKLKPIKDYWFGNVPPSVPTEVGSVCGAAMGMRKKVFESVGGFDEKFFLYWEEFDLAIRVSKKKYRIIFDPTISIIHEGELSTIQPRMQVLSWFRESRYYFFKKHFGRLYAILLEGWLTFSEEWRYIAGIIVVLATGCWFYRYGWWLGPGYLSFWESWLGVGINNLSIGYWLGVGGAVFALTMVYNELKSASRWRIFVISVFVGIWSLIVSVIGPLLLALGGLWMIADLQRDLRWLRKGLVVLVIGSLTIASSLLVTKSINQKQFFTTLTQWNEVAKLINKTSSPVSIQCVGCVTGNELKPLIWILSGWGVEITPNSNNPVYLFLPPISLNKNLLPDALTIRSGEIVLAWPLSNL